MQCCFPLNPTILCNLSDVLNVKLSIGTYFKVTSKFPPSYGTDGSGSGFRADNSIKNVLESIIHKSELRIGYNHTPFSILVPYL